MPLFDNNQRTFAQAVSRLAFSNPFLPERLGFERDALGDDFVADETVWSVKPKYEKERFNIAELARRTERLAVQSRQKLIDNPDCATREELGLYEDLALYLLYYRLWPMFSALLVQKDDRDEPIGVIAIYNEHEAACRHFLNLPRVRLPMQPSPAHILAVCFQIRRAFHFIFTRIAGSNLPAARLRATVWQSVFTHDVRRHLLGMYQQMGDFPTLITGPSGTGKEIIASAIGLSRYIPFDPKTQEFAEDYTESFHPLNLSALSPTLIESELFGHRKGAFTGAIEDRAGWMEVCPKLGSIFLDEIGEVDNAIQVKLLRVLQTRTFSRIGESKKRQFVGQIIAATNRDLAAEMKTGKFREDFYYRLCADLIRTPTLKEQLQDSPGDLQNLISFICHRVAGEQAQELCDDTERWITQKLGRDYDWPGNFRELEQCVRNIMIRKEYNPPRVEQSNRADGLAALFDSATISADDLLTRYVKHAYSKNGSYEETAKLLNLDRRTVKARVVK